MHLVPPERAGRRMIDEETVCKAIAGLPGAETLHSWADRYAILGDPTRLTLLLCIGGAGPISVSDLAVAADVNPDAVSQTLRLLRARGIVTAERDGRVMRYTVTDTAIAELLTRLRPANALSSHHH